jgi:hypothetical protein
MVISRSRERRTAINLTFSPRSVNTADEYFSPILPMSPDTTKPGWLARLSFTWN